MNAVDNTMIVRDMLDFAERGDFYEFSLLWRKKDHPDVPANETQRMIKNWEIDSIENFDAKIDLMRELAENNAARLYFNPQVRNKRDVNRAFLVWFAQHVDHTEVKYQNLTRSIIASCDKSRSKRWIIDIDRDALPDRFKEAGVFEYAQHCINFMANLRRLFPLKQKYDGMLDCVMPTPNGCHIVALPFNRNAKGLVYPFGFNDVKPNGITVVYAGENSVTRGTKTHE